MGVRKGLPESTVVPQLSTSVGVKIDRQIRTGATVIYVVFFFFVTNTSHIKIEV